jgi:hypothetical protein
MKINKDNQLMSRKMNRRIRKNQKKKIKKIKIKIIKN